MSLSRTKEIGSTLSYVVEETSEKRDDIIKSSMVLKDCRGSRLSIVIDQNNEYSFMIFDNNRKFRDGGIVKSMMFFLCRLETLIEKLMLQAKFRLKYRTILLGRNGVSIENEMFILRTIRSGG